MKIFVSSVVGGLEPYREAAARAARALAHDVKRSEDFGAAADSPQQACLAGIRWADAVVLILGGRYGTPQASEMSATHEEYREARGSRPVLAFVQAGIDRERRQDEFLAEVRAWETGVFTASFEGADDLRDAVTRALHDLELTQRAGPVDEGEMVERALAVLPPDRGDIPEPSIVVAVAAGPRQQVLRPTELEDPALAQALHQEGLFGDDPLLVGSQGVDIGVRDDVLVVGQDDRSIRLDAMGTVRIACRCGDREGDLMGLVVLEEGVAQGLDRVFRLAAWILNRVDPTRRLTDVVPVVGLYRGYRAWRTAAEHDAERHGVEMPHSNEPIVTQLTPPRRARPALAHERARLIEDFVTLLRRRARPSRY